MIKTVAMDSYSEANKGMLRAYKIIHVTDIWGVTRARRISLGRSYSETLDTAKDMISRVRVNNTGDMSGEDIRAEIVFSL